MPTLTIADYLKFANLQMAAVTIVTIGVRVI